MSIAWGRPIEYVESLPSSTIAEFKALNIISPFTPRAQAHREALIATLLYNQNITKKTKLKSVTDLFPYLDNETPDWLEDEKVSKAKKLIRSIDLHRSNPELYTNNLATIHSKIREEIELHDPQTTDGQYVIRELTKLIEVDDGKDV